MTHITQKIRYRLGQTLTKETLYSSLMRAPFEKERTWWKRQKGKEVKVMTSHCVLCEARQPQRGEITSQGSCSKRGCSLTRMGTYKRLPLRCSVVYFGMPLDTSKVGLGQYTILYINNPPTWPFRVGDAIKLITVFCALIYFNFFELWSFRFIGSSVQGLVPFQMPK